MAILQAFENSEFRTLETILAYENSEFHYSNSINAYENSEFNYTTTLQAYEGSEFFLWTADVYDVLTFSTPSSTYLEFIQPIVYFSLVLNSAGGSTDYSPYVNGIKFIKSLGGKTVCDVTMVEYGDGNITNFISDLGTGASYDKIVSGQAQKTSPLFAGICGFPLKFHKFSQERFFTLTISVGYPGQGFQSYSAPYMLPSQVAFDGTECHLKIEDFTALLEQENVNISPDIDADNGVIGYAHATTKSMAGVYIYVGTKNILSYRLNVVLSYPDYLLRIFRRTQGRPLDWIDQISSVYQAKRRWVGSTLYIDATKTADELSPKWSLIGHKHIIDGTLNITTDLSNYKNKFTIIRTSPNGGIIGEQECIGYDCPGRTGNINFDFPVNYCSATVDCANGRLENYVYFTPGGSVGSNPSWPGGPAYQGIAVNNVKFTYVANIGNTSQASYGGTLPGAGLQLNKTQIYSYTPRYRVAFRGKKIGSGILTDDDYKFVVAHNEGISCLGLHEEYGDIDDPIIPTTAVAISHANALIKEATRKVLHQSLETPFVNPWIEPGDCVAITDYETHQEGLKWLVEEVSITITGNDSIMGLTVSRGI